MGVEINMTSKQIDKKITKQIRIDAGTHQLLKVYASQSGTTIKAILEDYLSDLLAVDKPEVYIPKNKQVTSLKTANASRTQAEQNPVRGNANDNKTEGNQKL